MRTRALLQDGIELNLDIVVLGRLMLIHGRLVSWPSALRRNTRHRGCPGALHDDAAGDALVLALDGLVVLCALLVGILLGGFLGGFQPRAYALCIALLRGLGKLVLLQCFRGLGIEV